MANRRGWKTAAVVSRSRPHATVQRLVLGLAIVTGILEMDVPDRRLAWGQDDWNAGKQAVRQAEERGQMGAVMAPADFDRWLTNGRNPEQVQRTLESLLTLHVESAARTCRLSDPQKKKLELAGHGDMKRLDRSIEQLREKFRQVGQDQEKFQAIIREVSAQQRKVQSDPFGESSLYAKTLKQTLNGDQAARYEAEERKRRKFRYEAKIEVAMSNLETTIPLRVEQRQQLVKLLLEETQPPRTFGQYDYYVVLYQMRKLGEAKVKPLFDDSQWDALKRVLDQTRGLEEHLRANGALP